jgi:hypothetical protein
MVRKREKMEWRKEFEVRYSLGCLAVHLSVEGDDDRWTIRAENTVIENSRRTLLMIHSLILLRSKEYQRPIFCKTAKPQMGV